MINSQVAVLISPLYLGCGNSSFVVCVDPVFLEDARVLKISQVFGVWISATVLARLHPRGQYFTTLHGRNHEPRSLLMAANLFWNEGLMSKRRSLIVYFERKRE